MLTLTEPALLDEQKLRETLRYRSDELKFNSCLSKIGKERGNLELIYILDECDLEKALWALRALTTSQFDAEIRLMACDAVEAVLRNEADRHNYLDDRFPFDALDVSRAYAKALLNANQQRQFENRITYSKWMEKSEERWASNNPRLFGSALSEAAVKTMLPDVSLAAYFSILGAYSREMYPNVYETDDATKVKIVREFFESLR